MELKSCGLAGVLKMVSKVAAGVKSRSEVV